MFFTKRGINDKMAIISSSFFLFFLLSQNEDSSFAEKYDTMTPLLGMTIIYNQISF